MPDTVVPRLASSALAKRREGEREIGQKEVAPKCVGPCPAAGVKDRWAELAAEGIALFHGASAGGH